MGLFKKKPAVEPVDVSSLKAELVELRERLDASEQAKVVLEDRLSSIAATTMILTNSAQSNTAEIVEQIELIQTRLATSDAVGSKVDELHQRVIEVESRQPVSAEALPPPTDMTVKLTALSGRIEQVAQLAAAPAQPDDELAARLEQLTTSAQTVDALNLQLAALSSRVSAQDEMADQLRLLDERIGVLQQRSVDATEINERIERLATAAPVADDLGDRFIDLAARVAASEQLAAEARARSAELESRIGQAGTNDADELRSQLASLSGRIEAHDQLTHQLEDVEARLAASEADARTAREAAAALERRLNEAPAAEPVTDVTAQLEQLTARVAELDSRDLDVNRIHELMEQLRTNTPSNEVLDQQLMELGQRVAESEAAAAAARQQVTELDQRVTGYDGRIAEIGDKVGGVEHRIGEVDARLGGIDERVKGYDGRIAELDGRLGDVDGRLGQVPDRSGDIDHLHERINGTEEAARQAREAAAAVEQRLADDDTRQHLERQLDELRNQVAAQHELPDQLAALNARIGELQDRGPDVDRINERIEQLAASLPSTESVQDEVNRLAERIVSSEEDARTARELAAALEDRLGNIGTELANQLGELSTEMDSLASREPAPALTTAQVDEQAVVALKASQVKLASEQARYEITFREDLAALAEQVRQLRGRN
jgi:chromosome segregation ATPase